MEKTYIIPELNGEWYIDDNTVTNELNLTEYVPSLRNAQEKQLYVSYNGTEYAVTPEAREEEGITVYMMAFNAPELTVFQGGYVLFAPSMEVLRLDVINTVASVFPAGFETTFTFSMYTKDGKDEDTTGRAPSKNLTVTDFKSSQNMAFRLERVIKHLDPTAKIVDCTLWKLMDILESIVFSSESSPEQGVIDDGGGASL